MFFFIGFGYRNKQIGKVKFKCTSCVCEIFHLFTLTRTFFFFFLPVLNLKTDYILICSRCGTTYKLNENSYEKVFNSKEVDYEDIEKLIYESNFCPNCGIQLQHNFDFCPKCGEKLKQN